jgi:hypothetical protein
MKDAVVPGDRHDEWLLREKPHERELRGRHAFPPLPTDARVKHNRVPSESSAKLSKYNLTSSEKGRNILFVTSTGSVLRGLGCGKHSAPRTCSKEREEEPIAQTPG